MPDDSQAVTTQISNSQINAPVTTGDNNQITVYHLEEGAVVQIHESGPKPVIRQRPLPVDLRAQPLPGLQGRESEVARATAALADGRVIELFGPPGVGKTALLRFLEYEPVAKRFADGVIHLYQGALPALDQLQTLYDAFYAADVPYKPTESAAREALRPLRALVIIDDADRPREDLEELRAWMPAATFIFASAVRRLFGEGEAIPLQGLRNQAALALFERELGRPLTASEWPDATTLCEALAGLPLRLIEAAQAVRNGESLTDLAAKVGHEPRWSPLVHLSDAELLSLLAQPDQVRILLDALLTGGPADLGWPEATQRFLTVMEQLLQREPQEDHALLLFLSVQLGSSAGLWPIVLRLVRAGSGFLLNARLWATWQSLSQAALEAATKLGDEAVEAWALHQLGAHALCLGQAARAQGFLVKAEALRTKLGDQAGLKATQLNMETAKALAAAAKPAEAAVVKPGQGWLKVASLLVAAAAVGTVVGTQLRSTPERSLSPIGNPLLTVELAQLDFGSSPVGRPVARSVTLWNRGDAPAVITKATLSKAVGFHIVNPEGCQQLQPGKGCALQLQFVPTSAGTVNDRLTVTTSVGQKIDLALSGEGQVALAPQIAFSPSALDFGSVAVGSAAAKTLRVTNVGEGPLFLDDLSATLPDFTIQHSCGPSLAAHQSCALTVTFAPKQTGAQLTVITLKDAQANVSGKIQATGAGGQPDLIVTEFAPTGSGTNVRVVIQNQGTAPAPIFKVAVFGTSLRSVGGAGSESLVPFIIDGDRGQPTPFTKEPLAPGETIVLQGALIPGQASNFVVEVDSCYAEQPSQVCRVPELNESNNRRPMTTN